MINEPHKRHLGKNRSAYYMSEDAECVFQGLATVYGFHVVPLTWNHVSILIQKLVEVGRLYKHGSRNT